MNSRILKKLCKRAAPLLKELGDDGRQYYSCSEDSDSTVGFFEAVRCEQKSVIRYRGNIKSNYIKIFKNTIGVTYVSGYWEPEYTSISAWDSLSALVAARFTRFEPEGMSLTRKLQNPTAVFNGAVDLIAEGISKQPVKNLLPDDPDLPF